jgi:hypothetical protein
MEEEVKSMSDSQTRLPRRQFLASTLTAAAAGAAYLKPTAANEAAPTSRPIPSRPFGKTGLELPILGMGSSPLVAAWSRGYGSQPMSVEARAALVRRAYDRGVRYFDTARSYYDAEQVMGRGLKGVASHCVIATKVTVLEPEKGSCHATNCPRSSDSTSTRAISTKTDWFH